MLFIVCSFSSFVALLPLPVAHLLRLSLSSMVVSPLRHPIFLNVYTINAFVGSLSSRGPIPFLAGSAFLVRSFLTPVDRTFLLCPSPSSSCIPFFSSSRVLVDLGILFVLFLPCVS